MCGIVGYVGNKRVVPVIIDGLKRLEYRGYDSAGIAVCGNGEGLQIRRAEGKLRNLEEVIRLKPLDGTYSIGHTRWATHGRPTDVPAILYHTRDLFFLADGDLAVITPQGVQLTDFNGQPIVRQVQHVTWDPIMAEKGGFKHFMLKEIYEQPRAVRDTTLGRISQETGHVFLDEMEITEAEFKAVTKVNIAACGTS